MTCDPKHILIGIPSAELGGAEIQSCALARLLIHAGFGVTICCFHATGADILDMMRQTGARIVVLDVPVKGASAARSIALARRFAAAIGACRPHFVHLQYIHKSTIPMIVARLCGAPRLLVTVHFAYQRARSGWPVKFLAPRIADAVVCVSQSAEESFFGNSAVFSPGLVTQGRRHFAIPNGVDIAMIRSLQAQPLEPLREKLHLPDGPVVGIIARLRAIKGYPFLLRSMARVVSKMPAVKLLAVGDGKEQEALHALAKELGLENSVLWAGALAPDEAMRSLRLMDVVAVPSQSESFGLVAAEAMAAGRPVVASRVTGLRDIVVHGQTGLLVPYDDDAAMAQAITTLLCDDDLRARMGRQGQERAAKCFSLELFAQRYLQLYQSLGETEGESGRQGDGES
jgi:glycosyltransferase involved in cell wall biosynthesis